MIRSFATRRNAIGLVFCGVQAIMLWTLFSTGTRAEATPRLILVSIDGLQPDFVWEADRLGLQVPHLRSFLQQGTAAERVKGVIPTLTYPTHVSLMTGVHPLRHGITNNQYMDPFRRHQDAWMWYASEIKVPTLWERAKEAGLTTASIDFPVSVGARGVDYLIAQFWRDSTPLDEPLIRALSTPGLLEGMPREFGFFPNFEWDVLADQKRLGFVLHVLKDKKPDFMSCYFASVDHYAHRHGPYAPQTLAALEGVDRHLGKIIELARETQSIVVVVGDHGFFPIQSEVRLNKLFRDRGLLEVNAEGKLSSFQAYAWEAQGVAAIVLQNPQDHDLRQRVRSVLQDFAKATPKAVASILEADELHQWGGFPEASFLVAAREGYSFASGHEDPVVGAKPKYLATHGYLPSFPAMDTLWMMQGPGIPAGKNLGRVEIVDVAPTVAHLLGFSMPGVDGQNRLVDLPARSKK